MGVSIHLNLSAMPVGQENISKNYDIRNEKKKTIPHDQLIKKNSLRSILIYHSQSIQNKPTSLQPRADVKTKAKSFSNFWGVSKKHVGGEAPLTNKILKRKSSIIAALF